MAIFFEIVYDTTSKRHKLEFVNQQHDGLMGIRYDEETATYQLSVPLEFAQKVFRDDNGGEFDSDQWLALAQENSPKPIRCGPEANPHSFLSK